MQRHDASPDHLSARKSTEDFELIVKRRPPRWDDDVPDHSASTYPGAEHGPEPVPSWVITEAAARQADLGELKSGKEADVVLLERTLDDRVNLLAAKRYRTTQHRSFRNDATYRVGKEPRDGRVGRAIAKKTTFGMAARAGVWATSEFAVMSRLWEAGLPVPYPVQLSGTELVLEYLGDADRAAPRLAQHRPSGRTELVDLCDQAVVLLRRFAELKIAHADLSPYNTLVWHGRLWVIDLPQATSLTDNTRDAAYNPHALSFLHRDVVNLLGWFAKKGVDVDPEAVFGELVGIVYSPDR